MPIHPKIFVSAPADYNLSASDLALKKGIFQRLIDEGFAPQEFLGSGVAQGEPWSFERSVEVMRFCQGVLVLALGRFEMTLPGQTPSGMGASEYCQMEGAIALHLSLPLIVLCGEGVFRRGIAAYTGNYVSASLPAAWGQPWPHQQLFENSWTGWTKKARDRAHVFLGFCGRARPLAMELVAWLQNEDVRVHSYAFNFKAGHSLMDEIRSASQRCSVGLFLFTKDDLLEDTNGSLDVAAPRDNVIFEAGYFSAALGPGRVLVIRESGAKMPADLGGSIFLELNDRQNLASLHTPIRAFLSQANVIP